MTDLPKGYRWATEDEFQRYLNRERIQGAVTVIRTVDSQGTPYTHEEADLAVPFSLSDCVNWESNSQGDCGGRVEVANGVIVCETCRNRGI